MCGICMCGMHICVWGGGCTPVHVWRSTEDIGEYHVLSCSTNSINMWSPTEPRAMLLLIRIFHYINRSGSRTSHYGDTAHLGTRLREILTELNRSQENNYAQ